jgi:hypothetical protein
VVAVAAGLVPDSQFVRKKCQRLRSNPTDAARMLAA